MKRSFNTLAEVGRKNDMDNNHMLAIIEQKMFSDERKVCSRFLESTKKVHMRATTQLRSGYQPLKNLCHLGFGDGKKDNEL